MFAFLMSTADMGPTGLAAPNVVLCSEEEPNAVRGAAAGTWARLFCCCGAPADALVSIAGAVCDGGAALAVEM